jgi:hypothetical protein
MKASELRIGNLITSNSYYSYVYSIESAMPLQNERYSDKVLVTLFNGGLSTVPIDELEPIPLNEEWLLKFGFEWCNEAAGYFDNLHAVYLMYPNVQFHPFCTNDKDCWIELQYVHQLQNLCFALTGKELEIKLS